MEATAKNIDKTARTAREMAEAQRDSFEALAENFAAAQRRSMGLAEGGLEFVRMQEDNARAAQEFFARGVRLLQLQQKNAEFVRFWTGDAVEVLREQAEHNARTTEAFARAASRQQEGLRTLARGWVGAYGDFVAEEAAERTEDVLRQTEEATHEAELRTAVFGAFGTTDYDALTVEEVSKRVDGLSNDQLRKVREFEKNHKNRETLIEQIDRKIRANS